MHFDAIEKASQNRLPERAVNPKWGIDVFEDDN
jgi:hypothetical protein